MSAKAAIRTGDLNRLLKAAKAHGFAVERLPDGVIRLRPLDSIPLTDPPQPAPPSDPLDDELARWAAEHGYD